MRADEHWARSVAANPAAMAGVETYGIPLLPEEVAELERRLGRMDELLAVGASYGAEFSDGFAGAAVDPTAGYRLVLMYTRDIETHRRRLAGVPLPFRPDVRQATWTLMDLQGFETRIESATISVPGIRVYDAALDILANRVIVSFGAADPESGLQLANIFGSTGWLVPDWVGPFEPVDRPLGTLLITVLDAAGDRMPGLPCRYTSVEVSNPAEGGGDTTDAGQCRFEEVPAGRYRVDILEADELVDRLIKSVAVEVVAGKTLEITITIEDR